MPFMMRLDLMKQSNQISALTYDKVNKIIELLREGLGESQLLLATTLVTHSAIAIQRILQNQAVLEVDQLVVDDVQSREMYERASLILAVLQSEIDLEFNHAESVLMLAHLCSLLEKTEG